MITLTESLAPYTPPAIHRLNPAGGNPRKHGCVAPLRRIDDVELAPLADKFGSPLFIFSERALRDGIRSAKRAFERRHSDVVFAWSYKTNYLDAVCRVFHDEGAIAEVVSDFEYDKARANGIPGTNIILNGPHKPVALMQRAIEEGAKLQIDNLDELLTLTSLARGRSEAVPVAIRVYTDTGHAPVWSKFGFNADDGEAERVIRRIVRDPSLRLAGLHCHIGTHILNPEAYRVAVRKLALLAATTEACGGPPIEYVNMGGGFVSTARLHPALHPAGATHPSFEDYAAAICDTLAEEWPTGRRLPRLYLETGRALVDDAGFLLTSIVALKHPAQAVDVGRALAAYGKAPGHSASGGAGAPGLVVDAGVHLLYTSAWFRHNVQPVERESDSPTATTLYGCLCMNIDVIGSELPLPSMRVGEHLVIHPVGAYNITQSMQFITYRPAVVMIGLDGVVHPIRLRETLDDVRRLERIPPSLSGPTSQEHKHRVEAAQAEPEALAGAVR